MLVELGNPRPIRHLPTLDGGHGDHVDAGLSAPAVTYVNIPDSYTHEPVDDINELFRHLIQNPDVTNLPGQEALLSIVHQGGLWGHHGFDTPSWVWAEDGDFQQLVMNWYGCSEKPDNVEDTHFSRFGPPGVGAWNNPVEALFTDVGRSLWAWALGGRQTSLVGHGSAATATTFTTNLTLTTNAWAGGRLYAADTTNNVVLYGNVISNTNASNASVVTIDQWYAIPETGAAGTTPAAGFQFILVGPSVAAWYVGLTTTNITPAHGDTSLSGEITSQPTGLKRKIAPFALTSGVSPASYTLTPVYTIQGGDTSLPATVYAIGVFTSSVSGDTTDTMMFETTLNASATLTTTGDQLTITETVNGS